MGQRDGGVLGLVKLVDNGPNDKCFNIVLVAEGYRQDAMLDEMPKFLADCNDFLRTMFWAPTYMGIWSAINIFRLDVRSTDSGMDDPAICSDGTPGSGAQVATYFDSRSCDSGVRRLIGVDEGLVDSTVRAFVPEYHRALVIVNSNIYGGEGGSIAKFSTTGPWTDSALHELGHTFGLADEYDCYVCNGTDDGRHWGGFLWMEPGEPNITSTSTKSGLKWADLVLASTLCPTPVSTGPGVVGLFEGGGYYATALFRPELTCKMRVQTDPYCAVCERHIQQQLATFNGMPVTRAAPSPTLSVSAQPREKVLLPGPRGAYKVHFVVSTSLPTPVSYRVGADGSVIQAEATWPVIQVAMNLAAADPYAHSAIVEASVGIEQLDYWVPDDPAFTTVTQPVNFAFARPAISGGEVLARYDDPQSIVEGDSVRIGLKPDFGGHANSTSFWIEQRAFYSQLELEVVLTDKGFFAPSDDPTWLLRNVNWTPAPSAQAGSRATFTVSHQGGLWWLENDTANSAPADAGLPVRVQGIDAIGQAFDITGVVYPYQYVHTFSVSTVQRNKIPKVEWPMQFVRTREEMSKVTKVKNTKVELEGSTMKVGSVMVSLKTASIEAERG